MISGPSFFNNVGPFRVRYTPFIPNSKGPVTITWTLIVNPYKILVREQIIGNCVYKYHVLDIENKWLANTFSVTM